MALASIIIESEGRRQLKKRILVGAVVSLATLSLAGPLAGRLPGVRFVGSVRAGALDGIERKSGDIKSSLLGQGLGLQAQAAEADQEQAKLLAAGKKIFVERCAKCHDERGDKALKTGLPLSERELSDEEITRAVSGRLKNAPDEEKRAVALYVSSFMKRK